MLYKSNMELKKGLLKKDEKSYRIVLGVFNLVFSCGLIYRIVFDTFTRPIDWFILGGFTLLGIALVAEGFGFSIERLFGKAYILINPELISLKTSVFAKEQSVYWNNIKSIDYKFAEFRIEKTDNTNMILDLSNFNSSLKNEIKEVIDSIAKEKSIKI